MMARLAICQVAYLEQEGSKDSDQIEWPPKGERQAEEPMNQSVYPGTIH